LASARSTGTYIQCSTADESFQAFVPAPLPPEPPLALDSRLQDLMDRANRALGRLDGLSVLLPDTSLFIYLYVRKEALVSSQIEGTQSSFSDLLLFENDQMPAVPLEDVQEVSNYVAALNHGLARLRGGFPLSLRLSREIHAILLAKGRGSNKTPGEFRRSQNWVGGTRPGNARFVPPPPETLFECLGALEKFFHDDPVRTPTLLKAALGHVQFETIHPFLDGNGRLGRLLITFLLCAEGALIEPTLYLSLFFKRNRQAYYDHLQKVREEGAWEDWVEFFLNGVIETATGAVDSAKEILRLFEEDRRTIEGLGRAASSALRVHHLFQTKPLLTIPMGAAALELSRPTVAKALRHLAALGIARELTGKQRDRVFVYDQYLKAIDSGTEPFSRGGS
jgi:Fic family protein